MYYRRTCTQLAHTHNCQIELDLILPYRWWWKLAMWHGRTIAISPLCCTRSPFHLFFTISKLAARASCLVNCRTFVFAACTFNRCYSKWYGKWMRKREKYKTNITSSFILPLFFNCVIVALCLVNVLSALPLICAFILFQLISPTKKPLSVFY